MMSNNMFLCLVVVVALAFAASVHGFSTTSTTLQPSATTVRQTSQLFANTPMVPYKAPNSDYTQFVDINSAMYRDRTLMISKFIDETTANEIIGIILWMRKEDGRAPISIYFNCPGAQLRPALAVYDLLVQTRENCVIDTVNLGLCVGMASLLCAAGSKGKRSAMPNARFMLSRVGMDAPFRGQATDIALEVRDVQKWNTRMEAEISLLTGQPIDRIQTDMKRDFYLSSEEAVQYGLIDQVLLPAERKRAARGGEADLGAFEGEDEQRYQNQPSAGKGGWGSQQQTPPPSSTKKFKKKKKKGDDGPEVSKG